MRRWPLARLALGALFSSLPPSLPPPLLRRPRPRHRPRRSHRRHMERDCCGRPFPPPCWPRSSRPWSSTRLASSFSAASARARRSARENRTDCIATEALHSTAPAGFPGGRSRWPRRCSTRAADSARGRGRHGRLCAPVARHAIALRLRPARGRGGRRDPPRPSLRVTSAGPGSGGPSPPRRWCRSSCRRRWARGFAAGASSPACMPRRRARRGAGFASTRRGGAKGRSPSMTASRRLASLAMRSPGRRRARSSLAGFSRNRHRDCSLARRRPARHRLCDGGRGRHLAAAIGRQRGARRPRRSGRGLRDPLASDGRGPRRLRGVRRAQARQGALWIALGYALLAVLRKSESASPDSPALPSAATRA